MRLGRITDRLTAHRWTAAEAESLVGQHRHSVVAHAAEASVRDEASSGGAVSAILISLLEEGSIDGALVCVSSVEDGRVRARYRMATTRDEILAARDSVYVLGDFVGEAVPLIEQFEGRVGVVALPCELTALRRRSELDGKVVVHIALFCGHTTEPSFMDAVVDKLTAEAGGGVLTAFRFRIGHWRGRMRARFADGMVLDKPSSYYKLYQNLYFGAPKKCMFCGDHFGYAADISAGDLWAMKYKDDPIKHTALIVKTAEGAAAVRLAVDTGRLETAATELSEILDGQRRIAPFHFNVSARSQAGVSLGMRIPDKVGTKVRWHERLAARIALKNHLAAATEQGAHAVISRNRRLLKAQLYVLKGLESLPTGPLVARTSSAAKTFAIIAATVWGNRGAEAMLETSVGRLRDRVPDAEFVVYSYLPTVDAALVSDPRVKVRSSTPKHLVLVLFPFSLVLGLLRLVGLGRLGSRVMPASVRDLYGCDALIDLAGVSFIDGREKFLPFNLLTIWPAMLLGVPVFKLSQALGPFSHFATRLASRTLWRCRMVVPRGAGTLDHLREAGFPESLTYPAPDVAFGFEERDALSSEGAAEVEALLADVGAARSAGVRVLGLCPSAVIAGKAASEGWDYVGFLADIVHGLLEDGAAVVLFPNATRASEAEKLRNNDLPVIAGVVERLGDAAGAEWLLAVRGDVNAAEIRSLVAACDAVAVSRFHAMVGALTAQVPVLVLGWSHKYAEVMEQFGLAEWVFDYAEHDAGAFLGRFREMQAQREAVAERIGEALPSVKAASVAQFDELLRRL